MEEIWKDIPGYEGAYQASTHGRIKSLDRICPQGGYKLVKNNLIKGKILKLGIHRDGYLKTFLSKKGNKKCFTVHRLIALTFLGPRPIAYATGHLNGNRKDNRIENLKYVTYKENSSHLSLHGTLLFGTKHPRAKFTEEMVTKLRSEYRPGRKGPSSVFLSKKYNLPVSSVRNVVYRLNWKHI